MGEKKSASTQEQQRIISPRVVIQVLFFIVVIPFLPLLISGRWDWWEAWVYAVLSIAGFAISRALAARRHPDLIAERARYMQQENIKPWDRRLAVWLGLGGVLVLAGRRAGRAVELVSGVQRAGEDPGASHDPRRLYLGFIRLDRKPLLLRHGTYPNRARPPRRIEWPLPLGTASRLRGALLTYLATPLFLDSPWALLPTALIMVLMVVRTALEDRVLQDELAGLSRLCRAGALPSAARSVVSGGIPTGVPAGRPTSNPLRNTRSFFSQSAMRSASRCPPLHLPMIRRRAPRSARRGSFLAWSSSWRACRTPVCTRRPAGLGRSLDAHRRVHRVSHRVRLVGPAERPGTTARAWPGPQGRKRQALGQDDHGGVHRLPATDPHRRRSGCGTLPLVGRAAAGQDGGLAGVGRGGRGRSSGHLPPTPTYRGWHGSRRIEAKSSSPPARTASCATRCTPASSCCSSACR